MPARTVPDNTGIIKPSSSPSPHEVARRCRAGVSQTIKLTAVNLAALEPPAERAEVFAWSVALPGFGVRVLRSGRKSWFVQYRLDGKTRRESLGDVRVEEPGKAERRAREILAAAREGRDLRAEKLAAQAAKAAAQAETVAAIAEEYLADRTVGSRRSYGEIARYLRRVWAPLHPLSAETIGRAEITPLLRRIAAERGETSANRARSALSGMFVWAVTNGFLARETSPVAFTPKYQETSRDRVLTLEELGAIWRMAPSVDPRFGAIVRLLILSGARRGEVAGLRWSELDLEGGVWSLPAARSKNGRPHLVPLAPAAVAILQAVPQLSSAVFVPAFIGWANAKQKLDRLVKLEQPWVLHDVRRSIATHLVEIVGADHHLVELILNHASGTRAGVAGTYNRSQRLVERRRVFRRWAELVVCHVAGEAAESARVIPLR